MKCFMPKSRQVCSQKHLHQHSPGGIKHSCVLEQGNRKLRVTVYRMPFGTGLDKALGVEEKRPKTRPRGRGRRKGRTENMFNWPNGDAIILHVAINTLYKSI